jgi:hypothetical protein
MNGLSRVQQVARSICQNMPAIPSRVAKRVSADIALSIQDEFDAGTDPYGEDWAELRPSTLKKHGPPPLTDTTAMRGALSVRPARGAGIDISLPRPAGFHQKGTEAMAARKILPTKGMPDNWEEIIFDAVEAEFHL